MLKANAVIEVHVQGSSSRCVIEGLRDVTMTVSFSVVCGILGLRASVAGLPS